MRQSILMLVAVVLGLAVWWQRQGVDVDDVLVEAVEPARPSRPPSAAPAESDAARPPDSQRGFDERAAAIVPARSADQPAADLFDVPPMPKPVVTAAPPPPPEPVRLPFVLLGRMLDGGHATAIVREGERVVTLTRGDRRSGFTVVGIADQGVILRHDATGQIQALMYSTASGPMAASGAAPAVAAEAAPVEQNETAGGG